jgi:hypothetical protein
VQFSTSRYVDSLQYKIFVRERPGLASCFICQETFEGVQETGLTERCYRMNSRGYTESRTCQSQTVRTADCRNIQFFKQSFWLRYQDLPIALEHRRIKDLGLLIEASGMIEWKVSYWLHHHTVYIWTIGLTPPHIRIEGLPLWNYTVFGDICSSKCRRLSAKKECRAILSPPDLLQSSKKVSQHKKCYKIAAFAQNWTEDLGMSILYLKHTSATRSI